MVPPTWMAFVVGPLVIVFGLFRLRQALRKPPEAGTPSFRKKGLFAPNPRRHALFGVVYLLLGGYVIAGGFGYHLLRGDGCQQTSAKR